MGLIRYSSFTFLQDTFCLITKKQNKKTIDLTYFTLDVCSLGDVVDADERCVADNSKDVRLHHLSDLVALTKMEQDKRNEYKNKQIL